MVERHADPIADALDRIADSDTTVAWLQAQSCSGCTVSLLQSEHPRIETTLSEIRERIAFHPTLMREAGDRAMAGVAEPPDILLVEGAVPTEIPRAATLGTDERGNRKPILDWIVELGESAEVILAVGSCAAYGGLPAAGAHDGHEVGTNPTGAKGLQFDGRDPGGVFGPDFRTGRGLPVINVPGCPVFPSHLLLTLATVLNGHDPALDEFNRPLPLFGPLVHDECALREAYEAGEFAGAPGEEGCLYDVGCAGVHARCDGSMRLRNDGTSICRHVGAPCIGCVEPAFWDRFTPFYEPGEDDGRAPGLADGVSDPAGYRQRVQSTIAGWIVTAGIAMCTLPLLPVVAVAWLLADTEDREPISWSDRRW